VILDCWSFSDASWLTLLGFWKQEIYKEVVKDLLTPKGLNLKVREAPGRGVWVEGLSEVVRFIFFIPIPLEPAPNAANPMLHHSMSLRSRKFWI
jgi:hypothetical protein